MVLEVVRGCRIVELVGRNRTVIAGHNPVVVVGNLVEDTLVGSHLVVVGSRRNRMGLT